jgi:hypothetical protein
MHQKSPKRSRAWFLLFDLGPPFAEMSLAMIIRTQGDDIGHAVCTIIGESNYVVTLQIGQMFTPLNPSAPQNSHLPLARFFTASLLPRRRLCLDSSGGFSSYAFARVFNSILAAGPPDARDVSGPSRLAFGHALCSTWRSPSKSCRGALHPAPPPGHGKRRDHRSVTSGVKLFGIIRLPKIEAFSGRFR